MDIYVCVSPGTYLAHVRFGKQESLPQIPATSKLVARIFHQAEELVVTVESADPQ